MDQYRLNTAAQKGAALAKAAMADPEFRRAAISMSKESEFMGDVGKNVGAFALTSILGGATIGLANAGVKAVNQAFSSLTEGRAKAKGMSEMLSVHKQLGQEDKTKVQQAYNTLWKFNPDAAKDPLVAGSFVQRAVDYGGVTADEVHKLVQTRKLMRESENKYEGGFMPTVQGIGNLDPMAFGKR